MKSAKCLKMARTFIFEKDSDPQAKATTEWLVRKKGGCSRVTYSKLFTNLVESSPKILVAVFAAKTTSKLQYCQVNALFFFTAFTWHVCLDQGKHVPFKSVMLTEPYTTKCNNSEMVCVHFLSTVSNKHPKSKMSFLFDQQKKDQHLLYILKGDRVQLLFQEKGIFTAVDKYTQSGV